MLDGVSTRRYSLAAGHIAVCPQLWLGVPGLAPVSLINAGSNGALMLPGAFDPDLGPLPLFPVAPALPRGSYELSCRILDPTTGRLLAADLNPFVIQ